MRDFVRALPTTVEVLGRTIEGLALSWNRAYRVSDDGGATFYAEGWRPRAFEEGLAATGNIHEVRVDHADLRVGRVAFSEAERGLVFQATADTTPPGDAALEKAKAGRFVGVSLRYTSDRQNADPDGVVWRKRGVARELSLIESIRPQYEDAEITAVRGEVELVRALDEIPGEAEAIAARAAAWADLQARARANLARDVSML